MHDLPSEVLGEVVLAVDELSGAGLRAVTLRARPAAVTGVVGAPGAGGTALLDAVCGLRADVRGSIRLGGVEVLGEPPVRLARRGIARSFDPPAVVAGLSALDNTLLSARSPGLVASLLGGGRARRREATAEAARILDALGVASDGRHDDGEATLRLVCVARALGARPRLLLLDEPLAGLSLAQAQAVLGEIARLVNETGASVLIATSDLATAQAVCRDLMVLERGQTILQGPASVVGADPVAVAALAEDRGAEADG